MTWPRALNRFSDLSEWGQPMKGSVHENVRVSSGAACPNELADSFCWESVNHQVAFSLPYRA